LINALTLKEHCPAPAKDVKMLMCGPPAMMTAMIKILTEELGFTPQSTPPSSADQIQRF
jgi:cytochrome-b5 reductase